MKVLTLECLVLFLATATALRCWHCENEESLEACTTNGQLKECLANQEACETVIRRDGDDFSYFKHCKQRQACLNNQQQNPQESILPRRCRGDEKTSVCFCCCFTDGCGASSDDCTGSSAEIPTVAIASTVSPEPIVCESPPEWDEGIIECEPSRDDGFYDLGSECQYLCLPDQGLVEGAEEFTTCQRANPNDPSSRETIWLPLPPECEDLNPNPDIVTTCLQPPIWEEGLGTVGTVICPELDPGSNGWQPGAECDYLCPEGHDLFGPQTATCRLNVFHPETSLTFPDFTPLEPPCCEPPCDSNSPGDYLFILDQSNSIGPERWSDITKFVGESMRSLLDNPLINVGLMIYGSRVVEERNIPFMKNEAGLADLIEILPYEELDKGTITAEALVYPQLFSFPSEFNDRPDVPNYVVVITDGVSSDNAPVDNSDFLSLVAENLHSISQAVLAIGINVPEESTELESIASAPFFVFNLDDNESYTNALLTIAFLTPRRLCDPICSKQVPELPPLEPEFR